MWKSYLPDKADQILQYNVGGGMIVPWSVPPSIDKQDNEIFCHWLCNDDFNYSRTGDPGLEQDLNLDDILFIGASVKLRPTQIALADIHKQRLRDSGCLHAPGTARNIIRMCEADQIVVLKDTACQPTLH
jgi:hypothetical protein